MTAIDIAHADLWLDQAVGHHVDGPLNAVEAEALTAKIKGYVGVTWVLLAAAHQRQAHKALGYKTWEAYVQAEFDMSRSRSYQLISQAKVVLEISEAVSTVVDISEREARDLAPRLDEAKAAAVDAVDALPDDASDEERAEAAGAALDELRSQPAGGGDAQDTSGASGRTPDAPAESPSSPPVPPVEHQTFVTCPTCGGTGEIEAKETAA